MDPVMRLELTFLAECWAAGPEAATLLDDDRIRTQMRGEAHRAAAIALRDALRTGAPRPAAADDSARLVLDVVLQKAAEVEHPSCAAAELCGLELELGLVNEALRSGRALRAGGSPHDLVMRRLELKQRIDRGAGEIWKGPRRTA
jgi:hypothetical protein